MTAAFYAILIALNLIMSPEEFNNLTLEEQEQLTIIVEDQNDI